MNRDGSWVDRRGDSAKENAAFLRRCETAGDPRGKPIPSGPRRGAASERGDLPTEADRDLIGDAEHLSPMDRGWSANTDALEVLAARAALRAKRARGFAAVDALLVALAVAMFAAIGLPWLAGVGDAIKETRDNARACVVELERAVARIEEERCEPPSADLTLIGDAWGCACWRVEEVR